MTLYTHCQKCGRQLTSLSSKMRGYGWECWRKIQDEAPGLFDDDNVSEAEEVKTEKQGRTRKAGPRRMWHHEPPRSQGGQDIIENAVLLCDDCHYKRHNTAEGREIANKCRRYLEWMSNEV